MFPKLTEIVEKNITVNINEADVDLIKEIQTQLNKKGLYLSKIDGIVGELTKQALAVFKKSIWLAAPELVGKSTAASLLEIGEHQGSSESSQVIANFNVVNDNQLTGATMTLPTGELVYANQQIVVGIPLTWGEMTKDCKRVPESKDIVENIIEVTKVFGEVRDKWGSSIIVTSGYRPLAVNKAVGGASKSQHIVGKAIDCKPAQGDIYKFYDVVAGIMRTKGTGGLGRGMRLSFVHYDIRPGDLVVFDY